MRILFFSDQEERAKRAVLTRKERIKRITGKFLPIQNFASQEKNRTAARREKTERKSHCSSLPPLLAKQFLLLFSGQTLLITVLRISRMKRDSTKIASRDEAEGGKKLVPVILNSEAAFKRSDWSASPHAACPPPLPLSFPSKTLLVLCFLTTCHHHLQCVRADSPSSSVWDHWWAYDGISGEFAFVTQEREHDIQLIQ